MAKVALSEPRTQVGFATGVSSPCTTAYSGRCAACVRGSDGAVREEALLARERGVTFDIGHGAGSFGFHACRGLLAAGFRPDVISSDVHVLNIDGPAFDLLTTLSKFLVLGVDLNTLVAAVTSAPARAIRRLSLGTLAVGTEGDATIVDIEQGAFEFHDTQGERLAADQRFRLRGMVVGGKWWT